MQPIYLDYHATTPVDPRVLDAMLPYLREHFGNASSKTHPFGWRALEAIETARSEVSRLLGATPKEIVFTSGATESNNLAILGLAAAASEAANGAPAEPARDHVVTQATEHHAVLDPVRSLERRGFRVTVLPTDSEGLVDVDQLRSVVDARTLLVSVMTANNEVGAVQPVRELAAVCHAAGALFHTDAAQAAGRIPIDVEADDVDLLSISGHKFYAPKGVGALFVRRRRRQPRLRPLAHGGGQEGGLRPGTLNVPGIVGLGAASRLVVAELAEEAPRIGARRDLLERRITEALPEARVNGPRDPGRRLPGNLSLSFPGLDGAALLMALQDIGASAGSACSAGSAEPSYVLSALGLPRDLASATLRLGIGRFTTEAEVEHAATRIVETVGALGRAFDAARGR